MKKITKSSMIETMTVAKAYKAQEQLSRLKAPA